MAPHIRCIHIRHRPAYGTPVLSAGDILVKVMGRGVSPHQVVLDCHFTQAWLPTNYDEALSSITHMVLTFYGVVPLHSVFAYLVLFPGLRSLRLRTQDWRTESGDMQWFPERAQTATPESLLPRNLHQLEVDQSIHLRRFAESAAFQRRFTSLILHDMPSTSIGDLNFYLTRPSVASCLTSLTLDKPHAFIPYELPIDKLQALKHLNIHHTSDSASLILLELLSGFHEGSNLEYISIVLYDGDVLLTDQEHIAHKRVSFVDELLTQITSTSFPRLKKITFSGAPVPQNPPNHPPQLYALPAQTQTEIQTRMPWCTKQKLLVFY
ncbi:hypothetical protein MIND_01307700 [Mycena indigotica]|uniref:Uncharacterized protein n=1 Tax=Mycena indigotica TaxID=2126181 RepID=A0A8H6S0I2_9AGAR|nr:uncharacterized protein MIND_01307700 [Mycena indigotica]KAF7290674.1 hypothetical protein MIND_01307700 [Mycena indigotica]